MRDYTREAEISEALKELLEGFKSHKMELGVMEGNSGAFEDVVFVVLDKTRGGTYRFDKEYRICKV